MLVAFKASKQLSIIITVMIIIDVIVIVVLFSAAILVGCES